MNETIYDTVFMLVFVCLGVTLGISGTKLYETQSLSLSDTSYSDCNNLSLSDTSYCLRDWISSFFNYTERDENKYTGTDGTLEDIKLNGGDCYDYTKLYQTELDNKGFNTKKETIYPDNKSESGHGFLIAWDKELTEYCTIDSTRINREVNCMKFVKNE